MNKKFTVAVDVGGSGGKMAAATYDNHKITLHHLINFDNPGIINRNTHKVDAINLFKNIKSGLHEISLKGEIDSFGIDTWGGSYGYIDKKGSLIGDIFNCRDHRTVNSFPKTQEVMSNWEIYSRTGQNNSRFSVLSHIHKDLLENKPFLSEAEAMLLLPSLLTFLFTGVPCCESTMASTTCLTDPTGLNWDPYIIDKFNIPAALFPKLAEIGTLNGFVTDKLSHDIGSQVKVINTAGHDTASALSVLPLIDNNDCFISIGTTIVIGSVTSNPIISKEAQSKDYKNAVDGLGRNFLSTDVTGFWIINEIRKFLASENHAKSFDELHTLASEAPDNESFFDPCSRIFKSQNANMLSLISSFLQDSGQKVPEDLGGIIRCVFESYAMRIKYSLQNLLEVLKIEKFNNIYVISGGTRNKILMQMIADALDQKITVGIPWATLFGNLIVQMLGLGVIDKKDLVAICSNSWECRSGIPQNSSRWQRNYEELMKSNLYQNK